MRIRDALFDWKIEKGRKTARRTGPFGYTWFRMVVYFWLNLNPSRSAKFCFENKIRIWNHQGCKAAAAPCARRPDFISVSDICRLQTPDYWLQICRLQTADCRLQTANSGHQTVDYTLETRMLNEGRWPQILKSTSLVRHKSLSCWKRKRRYGYVLTV